MDESFRKTRLCEQWTLIEKRIGNLKLRIQLQPVLDTESEYPHITSRNSLTAGYIESWHRAESLLSLSLERHDSILNLDLVSPRYFHALHRSWLNHMTSPGTFPGCDLFWAQGEREGDRIPILSRTLISCEIILRGSKRVMWTLQEVTRIGWKLGPGNGL